MSDLRQIPDEFWNRYPDIKPERAQRYYARYLQAINQQLVAWSYRTQGHCRNFGLKQAHDDCGSFQYNGQRVYIWSLFHELQPIVHVLEQGTNLNKQVSKVMINEQYIQQLVDTHQGRALIEAVFEGVDVLTAGIDWVPVDLVSLDYYIADTQDRLSAGGNEQYIAKLQRNLAQARYVRLLSSTIQSQGVDQQPAWPQIPAPSAYGRMYYQGVNIQNVGREVRKAALGQHYQYDLRAAVYAIKLTLAQAIYSQIGESFDGHFTYTKEYLEYRGAIRRRLSAHIQHYPEPERLVKQAMTAVGFGARLQDSTWTDQEAREYSSLQTILRNPADRERFVTDPWVQGFVAEQSRLNKIISEYYLSDPVTVEYLRTLPNMLTPTGRIRRSQVVVWAFQTLERQIMLDVFGDQPVTGWIHDAVISQQPLDLALVRERLRGISQWLFVDSEHESRTYSQRLDAEVQAHRALIQREELRLNPDWQPTTIRRPRATYIPQGLYLEQHPGVSPFWDSENAQIS